MRQRLHDHWQKTPPAVRKPVVLVVGILLVLSSGLVGWLPGPGGIPILLAGIAVLASEFSWAQALKDRILAMTKRTGIWFRTHPVVGSLLGLVLLSISLSLSYLLFMHRPGADR